MRTNFPRLTSYGWSARSTLAYRQSRSAHKLFRFSINQVLKLWVHSHITSRFSK